MKTAYFHRFHHISVLYFCVLAGGSRRGEGSWLIIPVYTDSSAMNLLVLFFVAYCLLSLGCA